MSKSQHKTLSIVLPTYNESDNIEPIVTSIQRTMIGLSLSYEIIFVDDSTDGTVQKIKELKKSKKNIRLIHRQQQERTGLATAMMCGMEAASGDYICCLDADLQHPPRVILHLLENIITTRSDIAVASRYVEGGSAKGLGGLYRKVASHVCRMSAWLLLPGTKSSTDPGSGFFLLTRSFFEDAHFGKLYGYKVLIDLLARFPHARVVESPYTFRDRENDVSKSTLRQGLLFFRHIFVIFVDHQLARFARSALFLSFVFTIGMILYYALRTSSSGAEIFLITLAILLFAQAVFMIYLMIYAWENPVRAKQDGAPKTYIEPSYSFTLLIPARHEESVIRDTIKSIARLQYPVAMVEAFILINEKDDAETIRIAKEEVQNLNLSHVHIDTFEGPLGKPYGLNRGLARSQNDVLCVFDAEDEIHPQILNIVNTTMREKKCDVVQGGVQLMNYQTSWYALFNVMEYYFWFKSALHFFSANRIIPLGGNTVFFKRAWLNIVDGWEEGNLTEDADIGIRLSSAGARTRVVYESQYVTREEAPSSLKDFIKQRTRWNQGFIYTLFKGDWLRLPTFKQKILAFYILSWPIWQGLILISIPFSVYALMFIEMPPAVSVLTNVPLLTLLIIFAILNVGVYEFTKTYNFRYSPKLILTVAIFFIPYQLLLGVGAVRALWRHIVKRDTSWEKTTHFNIGRSESLERIQTR